MKKYWLIAGLLILFTGFTGAQNNWKEVTSVEDLCRSYPETVAQMFEQYDLDYPGLERVKDAYESGHLVQACHELLAYYREGNQFPDLRSTPPRKSNRTDPRADTILKDVFVIQNVRGQVPVREDGHRDWYYKGPFDDREWAWLSNRHSQLRHVYNVYMETGNPRYAAYMDLFLRDFIIASMPYPAKKGSESIWRGLEVSFRAKVWTRIFYGMIDDESLSPAAKLLILSSLPDHAHYNRNFHGGNNWLTMEISALATVAAYFPEYKKSDQWMDYAIQAMTGSMKDQVYPDGVQTELTASYHNVSLRNFVVFEEICNTAGRSLPEYFSQTIEDMYSYSAHCVRPDGNRPLNNDADLGSNRDLILDVADHFNKPEWKYIVTAGSEGSPPEDGPSWFYPWAGQMISRSGFGPDAHWSFFDVGPWGSGHQHNDKLHLSIAAFNRDLLVDAGRFAYTGEVARRFRPYARGSAGHNVLLIDGQGQDRGPTHAKAPLGETHFLITDDFDYANGSFEDFIRVKGQVEHTRAMVYVRGGFWIVADRVETDRARDIQALWHWHPDCDVEKNDLVVRGSNGRGYLSIIPLGEQKPGLEFVKGREDPMQGWYSPEYNIYEPNVASIYHLEIRKNTNLIWLLIPSANKSPDINAQITTENSQEVQLVVKLDGRTWKIRLPFRDSRDAKVDRLD